MTASLEAALKLLCEMSVYVFISHGPIRLKNILFWYLHHNLSTDFPFPGCLQRTGVCCGRSVISAMWKPVGCRWSWPARPAGSGRVCPTSTPCFASGGAWTTWMPWACWMPRECYGNRGNSSGVFSWRLSGAWPSSWQQGRPWRIDLLLLCNRTFVRKQA